MRNTTDPARAKASLAPWFGLLGGHVAWSTQLLLSYYLLLPLACATGQTIWLHLATLAAVLVTIAAGLAGYRTWRSSATGDWPALTAAGWLSLMGLAGILLSAIFVVLITLTGLASFVIHPCTNGSPLKPPV